MLRLNDNISEALMDNKVSGQVGVDQNGRRCLTCCKIEKLKEVPAPIFDQAITTPA